MTVAPSVQKSGLVAGPFGWLESLRFVKVRLADACPGCVRGRAGNRLEASSFFNLQPTRATPCLPVPSFRENNADMSATPPKSFIFARRWLQVVFFIFSLVELWNASLALFFQEAAAKFYGIRIDDKVMTQQYGIALVVIGAAYAMIGLDPVANRRLLFLPLVEVVVAMFWTLFLSRGAAGGPSVIAMHFGYCVAVGLAIVIPTAIVRNHAEAATLQTSDPA
jgi:hypothetical protein